MNDILERLHGFEIVFTDGGGRGWGWAPVTLVREAADEIEQLREYGAQARIRENAAEQARVSLSFENERLRSALDFYADPEVYKAQDRWCPARGNIALASDIQNDEYGNRARGALNIQQPTGECDD
jgi:hypothetical protein